MAGFTGRHDFKPENARLSLIGGFYFNADGMDHFVGNMVAGQVVYGRKCNSANFNFATGLFFYSVRRAPETCSMAMARATTTCGRVTSKPNSQLGFQ